MPKIIHTMIRVLDLDKSQQFYQQLFELEETNRLVFPEFTLLYLKGKHNDMELELTANHSRTTPCDLGDGYGHLAFCVDDLAKFHVKAQNLGLDVGDIVKFKPADTVIATFFFIHDPDGYQIEVLERHGHYQ